MRNVQVRILRMALVKNGNTSRFAIKTVFGKDLNVRTVTKICLVTKNSDYMLC